MKLRKNACIFVVLLVILQLLQLLTTRFHELGKYQIPLILGAMLLMGLPFGIWLRTEILKAIEALGMIGLFIPGILASTLLLGPYSVSYGWFFGFIITILVSAGGSFLFWTAALSPRAIERDLDRREQKARENAAAFRMPPQEVRDGFHALLEMDRRKQRRPPQ